MRFSMDRLICGLSDGEFNYSFDKLGGIFNVARNSYKHNRSTNHTIRGKENIPSIHKKQTHTLDMPRV